MIKCKKCGFSNHNDSEICVKCNEPLTEINNENSLFNLDTKNMSSKRMYKIGYLILIIGLAMMTFSFYMPKSVVLPNGNNVISESLSDRREIVFYTGMFFMYISNFFMTVGYIIKEKNKQS